MVDFTEKMRLKGKAAEDIYFAEQEKKLIQALHEKQKQKAPQEKQQEDKEEQQDKDEQKS